MMRLIMRRDGAATRWETVTIDQRAGQTSHAPDKARVVVGAVLEDASVAVGLRSLSPHVSMMQAADAGQSHHLCTR